MENKKIKNEHKKYLMNLLCKPWTKEDEENYKEYKKKEYNKTKWKNYIYKN